MSALKTAFTLGAIGTAATLGGLVLMPFFGASAGAAAAAGATHGQILTSFWTPLVTGFDGGYSAVGAVEKIGSGLWALGGSALNVTGSGILAGMEGGNILDAMAYTWNSPT